MYRRYNATYIKEPNKTYPPINTKTIAKLTGIGEITVRNILSRGEFSDIIKTYRLYFGVQTKHLNLLIKLANRQNNMETHYNFGGWNSKWTNSKEVQNELSQFNSRS